jgi:hypothetical protein
MTPWKSPTADAAEALMALLCPLLTLPRNSEAAVRLEEALDDFVKAHMDARENENQSRELDY